MNIYAKLSWKRTPGGEELTTEEKLQVAIEVIADLEQKMIELARKVQDADYRAQSAINRLSRYGLR